MAVPLTKTKSAIPDEEMADFVYVRNLVRNDDLDTCVLDFLAQSVRNAGIGDDYVDVFPGRRPEADYFRIFFSSCSSNSSIQDFNLSCNSFLSGR